MPKMTPQVALPTSLAAWADPAWIRHVPHHRAWVQVGTRRTPISLVPLPPFWPKVSPGKLTLFVVNRSTAAQREALEREGLSYVDPSGVLHLSAPSLLVHLERLSGRRSERAADGSTRLGPAAVRVAIASLLDPEDLTIANLAKRASASLAQTHQTLGILERAGLVAKKGRGPQTHRTLTNRSGAADLLQQAVLRQKRPSVTPVFVYARRPEELWARLTDALGERAVVSGAAAASVLSASTAGASSIPRTLVRVSPDIPLEEAITMVGAERADSGANVELLVDKARWGFIEPQRVGRVRVANAVSTWLDCLREPRGEDVARHFREVTLGF